MDTKKSFTPIMAQLIPLKQKEIRELCSFYPQIRSLYLTKQENDRTKLIIYDIESDKEEEWFIEAPELLNADTCITQLPNGDLFCFGKDSPVSGTTVIIDRSYEVRILPYGTPCRRSSAIYFNNNVYCFGGHNYDSLLTLSRKFDLNLNRWINLTPMPHHSYDCSCAVFNGNILISENFSRNLLLYSIDIDSFSTIPYNFIYNARKILVNSEKLYLIEFHWGGMIYESEDEYDWKIITHSIIDFDDAQAYFSYNKEEINIAVQNLHGKTFYYKFDLNKKSIVKLK